MTYFVEATLWIALPGLLTYLLVTQARRVKQRSRR